MRKNMNEKELRAAAWKNLDDDDCDGEHGDVCVVNSFIKGTHYILKDLEELKDFNASLCKTIEEQDKIINNNFKEIEDLQTELKQWKMVPTYND